MYKRQNLTGIDTDLVSDTSPQLGGNLDVNTKNITFGDSSDGSSDDVLSFGAGSDLRLYHDGSNSYIKQVSSGTGNLLIFADGHEIQLIPKSGEPGIKVINDGAVELYHDATKKIDTVTGGARIFGYLSMQGSGGHIYLPDSAELKVGSGEDLKIYHGGDQNYVSVTGTGNLNLTSGGAVVTKVNSSEDAIVCNANGSVDLYHDNNKRLSTYNEGIEVFGIEGGNASIKLSADEGDDNNDQYRLIAGNGTSIYLQNYASGSWESNIVATGNGAVDLYHDNINVLSTASSGVDIKVTSGDTSIPPAKSLLIYNSNDSANTMAGIRFVATSNSSADHYIFQKKHGSGTGADLVISQNTTERIRFTEHGGITFNGDTAGANALDDYEEGTWTAAFSAGETCTNNQSTYTRIGRLVVTNCYISNFSNFDGNNSEFRITGLPFPAHNAQGGSYHGGGSITYATSLNYSYPLLPLVGGNNNYIYFHRQDGTTASWKYQDFHNTGLSSGGALIVNMIYETDY